MSAKIGKGYKLRPCQVCGGIVNYVLWKKENRNGVDIDIYHWANEDGTHHEHMTHGERMSRVLGVDVTKPVTLMASQATLRDYFAAKAMYGLTGTIDNNCAVIYFDTIAKDAYTMADAMMKARNE